MKKRILAITMAVMITGMTLAGCGESNEAVSSNNADNMLEVKVVSPKNADINITGEYVGTLEFEDQVNVFPLISGEITNVYFEEGDYVEEGEIMFTLDDKAYQLQLQNANKSYASAENGLNQQLGALEMQRNSAVNNLHTAQEGVRQIEDTYEYYENQKSDLDSTKDDLMDSRVDLKEDLNKLRKDRDKAKDDLEGAEKEMNDAATAYYTAMQKMAMGDPTINQAAITLLKANMDAKASAYSGLAQKIAAYDSAEPQLESAIKQYDSSMDQLDSSKDGIQFQQDNLDYSLQQAKRGEILAQNNLDYFDNYTLPMTQEAAEISLSQAKIGISSAQLQLEHTKVKAPVSGKVYLKNNDTKDLAQAGYPVYVILPENTKYAAFNVPETVCSQLNIGDEVTVERNGVTYKGRISEIPTTINQQTGMFTVKAAVTDNADELVTGTSVVVTAVTKSLPGVTTIPIDCVYYEGGNTYTYAVSKDGIISKVYIETGLYDNENMEIKSGITPDMQIITTWSSDYHDGLKVVIAENN